MIYLSLFWSFFQIGLFSIGGGYAAMPLIQHQVTELHSWLTMTQFADIITIAEMTPGAIVATLGCVFPSCVIVMLLAWVYYRYRKLSMVQGVLNGLRPAVVAMIASAGLSILILAFWDGNFSFAGLADTDWIAVVIFAAGFFVLRKWKPNPIYVMAGAGALGVLAYSLLGGGIK